jgi:alcohol dehydrogenase YqhD (iron-dependent ADH family)
MDNFTFYNPTKIDFGIGKEERIGQHLAEHGIRKVLLCYGSERIKRDGLFATVSTSLAAHAVDFVECGGIVSNPLLSKVREAIALAREHQVEAILSVGGGSVLDSSKAIAAGTLYAGDVWDLFIGKGSIGAALPVFDILTLAATGSEMNNGAVVTNDATREKFAIGSVHTFPKVSIVNPALMQTVSRDYLVYSAADVIAHAIEGYFTATDQPTFHSRMVEAIITTVIETTETLLVEPGNYAARAEFAWASTQALNDLCRHRRLQLSQSHDRAFAVGALQRAARRRSVGGHAGLDEVVSRAQSGPVHAFCQIRLRRRHARARHRRAGEVVRQDRHADAPVATGHLRSRAAGHDRKRPRQCTVVWHRRNLYARCRERHLEKRAVRRPNSQPNIQETP